jgi:hypothetical protein
MVRAVFLKARSLKTVFDSTLGQKCIVLGKTEKAEGEKRKARKRSRKRERVPGGAKGMEGRG